MPYFPTSRRFRNPLYIRIEQVPGADSIAGSLASLAGEGRALNGKRRIDRDAVHRLKLAALKRLWSGFSDPGFERYRQQMGTALEDFATWCTLAEMHGERWHAWPAALRHPRSKAVQHFRAQHDDRVRFHQWLQWLLERQLERAGKDTSLIADLAIGFDPEGADAWLWQDCLAPGIRVGAPPDEFVPQGQDWGLPAFDPWKLRALDYAPFIETIRAGFQHAGGLRIDHVMGLFRLWWIPAGGKPGAGAYVRYPARELLDIVALEAARAGAWVIGEDLGTVEPATRRELGRRNVLSYRVFWFESKPPERYPERALASMTTHDLPTLAGVWTGLDSGYLRQIGQQPFEEYELRQSRRLQRISGVPAGGPVGAAAAGAYAALGRSPSLLVTATMEDLLGISERPNFPGTTQEQWPNWSLALPLPVERIERDTCAAAILEAVRRARG